MIPENYECEGQMSIFDLPMHEGHKECLRCFHEYHDECCCLQSKYFRMQIPWKPCSYYDPVMSIEEALEMREGNA